MRISSKSRFRLLSSSASMRSSTFGRASEADIQDSVTRSLPLDAPLWLSRTRGLAEISSAQNSTQRAAHNGAADRVPHRSRERLSEAAHDLARHAIGDRPGDLTRDQLPGRETIAARIIGAENRAQDTTDLADNAALLRRAAGLSGRRGG